MSSSYKKYTPLQHVLARPDTYVGSLNPDVSKQWVVSEENMKMIQTSFVGGLFKIFDEILVNALDQVQVDEDVDKITVDVDVSAGSVCVSNTGKGIPIEQHAEYNNVWVPELIFGELLTSSNYDDSQERTTGGRNGYGAKLANIFSKRFIVETIHNDQRYVQEWTDNMSTKTKPKITKAAKKGLTKITFFPDFARFGMTSFENEDIVSLFERRTYDAAACSPPNVKVFYNGKNLGIKTFEKYVDCYIGTKKEATRVFETSADGRWEIALAQSDCGFQQVSFVNGIHTSIGGAHVEYIGSQLVKRITEHILSKHKELKLKPQHIKDHMFLFVRSTLTNPSFSSQTKTECTSRWKDFGTSYRISEDFVKKVLKLPFIHDIIALVKHKEQRDLNKTDGRKLSVIKGIPKLEDANKAGTMQSEKCTLILTEGDSAKTFAISGLGVIGRDYYGVFPLKGKLLNVRDASAKQLANNEEIVNIKQIMGLQNNKEYTSTRDLRYGHVMILTDADVDGSHIKGLFINFIHAFWPSLLENVPNFLTSMRTPILKCVKGTQSRAFYTKQDYDRWKAITRDGGSWKIKYYKGLGTSSANEARDYFRDLETNKINYSFDKEQSADIDLAFKKTMTHERKRWIGSATDTVLDTETNTVSVADFIHKDLIWFSVSDNVRSIPSMVDGLKPSQRKVLHACRKRTSNSEIKVSQLSGYVSTETAYHHGEQSLMGTIINMAQDHVGSNNIQLLLPKGQFGTRLMGGKDAASPRYIFTQLSAEADKLFHKDDDPLLTYLEDDGTPIEPVYFVPTLPLVLINGTTGIGTGYSTQVPCYNPIDIRANVTRLLNGQEQVPMTPWYHGFKGTITEESPGTGKYTTRGTYNTLAKDTVEITELPIGTWTNDYKEFIDGMLVNNEIKGYENHSTETDVRFVIKLNVDSNICEKKFKLTSTVNTTNMHLFDANKQIQLYESPEAIVADFVKLRLKYYTARKEHLLKTWNASLGELSEKYRFIQLVMDDKVMVFRKTRHEIIAQLRTHGFEKNADETLLGIKISAFTSESLSVLETRIAEFRSMIHKLTDKTPNQMWSKDLL
jgi:DNA topoisomerase-2